MRPEKEAARLRHDEAQPISLGCVGCPDLKDCGGIQAAEGIYDCAAFCICIDPRECQFVCRRNLVKFVRRHREVRGFGLENVARAPILPHPKLSGTVPLLYHGYRRKKRLVADTVAIRLFDLYDPVTGMMKFRSRSEIARRFRFKPGARLIVIGVDKDKRIEPYWGAARAARITEAIAALGPDVVTSPNFSLFLNVPRYDNLHSVKRIAISWQELVEAGVFASLHVNARNPRDWERWTEFVAERDEVRSVSFEFRTGAAVAERGAFHARMLCELARSAGRPLQLVMRSGRRHLDTITRAFDEVVFIDSGPFVKAVHRRFSYLDPAGVAHWGVTRTEAGQPIDDILQNNVDLASEVYSRMFPTAGVVTGCRRPITNAPYLPF